MSSETPNTGAGASKAALLVLAWSGLTGGAGVALAAVAAHKVESPAVATAAQMLMIHAAAAVAILSVSAPAGLGRAGVVLAAVMLAAVALFSTDVTVHALTGNHVFPFAAPTGGSMLIVCWLALAILALLKRVRGGGGM